MILYVGENFGSRWSCLRKGWLERFDRQSSIKLDGRELGNLPLRSLTISFLAFLGTVFLKKVYVSGTPKESQVSPQTLEKIAEAVI